MRSTVPDAPSEADADRRRGFMAGVVAYALWGVLPIYFKAVGDVSPVDIVAHRVLWSVPFLAILLSSTGGWPKVAAALRHGRTLRLLMLTAALIAVNWLLYIYAVVSGHILAGSLGYYLNPLANVLLGRFILKERLSWLQWTAVAIAAAGIAALLGGALGQLWISLTLCLSFATYGLLRKIASVDAIPGLGIETGVLMPIALIWLGWSVASGGTALGTTTGQTTLLLLSGVVTMVPLLLFTAAARRLPYSTLGMLQFLAPTLQFLLAVFFYGEALTWRHAIAFGAIWIALALYVTALVRARQPMYSKPCPELAE